jgi:hypothetical protein
MLGNRAGGCKYSFSAELKLAAGGSKYISPLNLN